MTSFSPTIRSLPGGELDAVALIDSVTPQQLAWWAEQRFKGNEPFLYGRGTDDDGYYYLFFIELKYRLTKNNNYKIHYFDFVANHLLDTIIENKDYDSSYSGHVRDFLFYAHIKTIKERLFNFVITTAGLPHTWMSVTSQYGSAGYESFFSNLPDQYTSIALHAFSFDNAPLFIKTLHKFYELNKNKTYVSFVLNDHIKRFLINFPVDGKNLLQNVMQTTKDENFISIIQHSLQKQR